MSTEHDETRPLPRPAAHEGPVGDHPTTPIPRAGAGRGEDRTEVLGTTPQDEPRPEPTTERFAAARAQTGSPVGTPASSPTARTSAFAAAASPAGRQADETSGVPQAGGAASRSATGSAGSTASGQVAGAATGTSAGQDADAANGSATRTVTDTWTPPAEPPVSTSMRVGTVVWGLVLAIIGAGVIAVAAGAQFDLELALIGLLALAGVALVVGSIVTSARRRR